MPCVRHRVLRNRFWISCTLKRFQRLKKEYRAKIFPAVIKKQNFSTAPYPSPHATKILLETIDIQACILDLPLYRGIATPST